MITNNDKELKLLDRTAREFARKELAVAREENDRFPHGPFFKSVLEKAFDLDFFHSILPEAHGGIGQGISSLCILLENICREDASLGGIMLTNSVAHELFFASNASELLGSIIGDGTRAEGFLIAAPVFNDPTSLMPLVTAGKNGDGYRLKGRLDYLVLGGIAAHAIVPGIREGIDGISFFLVDLKEKGVKISEPVESLGLHACPGVDLVLENARAILVGEEGTGKACFEKMVSKLSVAGAAMALGIMKGAFKEAIDYTQKRSQGGRRIIDWSEMRMILANMAITIKTSEMIVSRACQAMENNESGWEACSRAGAIQVHDMACNLTTDGIQVMGGVGYMKDFGQEKRFRDAKQIQSLFGITPVKKLNYLENIL
jgi:alkylation response protein AidB-like acyl-CoA dehydrogenase